MKGEIICLKSFDKVVATETFLTEDALGNLHTFFFTFFETDIFMGRIVSFKMFLPHSIHGTGIFT